MVRVADTSLVLALIHLSRVVGRDARVHDGWQRQSCIILVKDAFTQCASILQADVIAGGSRN